MDAVPAEEEVQVLLESPAILGPDGVGQRLDRGQQLVEGIRRPPAQAFFVVRAGTFSVLPIRSMYFCWAIWSTLDSVQ